MCKPEKGTAQTAQESCSCMGCGSGKCGEKRGISLQEGDLKQSMGVATADVKVRPRLPHQGTAAA